MMHDLGWVVLSGKTRVKDPQLNFHHAFVGSSNSSNDVCTSRSLVKYPVDIHPVCHRDVQGSIRLWWMAKRELCSQ